MAFKIAVITEEHMRSAWVMQCLENLHSIDEVEFNLHLIADKPTLLASSNWKGVLSKFFSKNLLFKLFYRLHSRTIKKTTDEIDKFGCRSMRTTVLTQGKFSYKFDNAVLDELQDLNLDVILLFGIGIIQGDILDSAKHGVWSHHHGDERHYRGRPACFWEYFYGEKTTGGILQKLSPVLDGGIVLERFFIRNEGLNYGERLNQIQFSGCRAATQVVKKILNGIPLIEESEIDRNLGAVYRMPENSKMLRFFIKSFLQKVQYLLTSWFMADYWCVGVGKIDPNISALGLDFESLAWSYYPLGDGFIADPYLFNSGNGVQVLLEDYSHKTRRGTIGKYDLNSKNQLVRSAMFLDNSRHLSFPSTFEVGEQRYFICESQTEGILKAYILQDGDIDEENSIVLLEEAVADPCIVEYKSQLWLFGSDENHQMSIWFSSTKSIDFKRTEYSPFMPNPFNSRSAGRPIVNEDKLLRFTQDCSGKYGARIHVYEIKLLTEKEYVETYIESIEPEATWHYKEGIHTLNILEDRFVVDAKTSRLISFDIFKGKCLRLLNY